MPERDHAPLSHLSEQGAARIVDVSAKPVSPRSARASSVVHVSQTTLSQIADGQVPKGDVLAIARIAGIQAAKRTSDLIPLCHPLPVESVEVSITPKPPGTIHIEATARIVAKTGVEMEALVAVSVAALTVYDMCKSMDRLISIGPIRLEEKCGGRSGTFRRDGSAG